MMISKVIDFVKSDNHMLLTLSHGCDLLPFSCFINLKLTYWWFLIKISIFAAVQIRKQIFKAITNKKLIKSSSSYLLELYKYITLHFHIGFCLFKCQLLFHSHYENPSRNLGNLLWVCRKLFCKAPKVHVTLIIIKIRKKK